MLREEFIKDFKELIIEKAYWNLPKEYRKSDEYINMSLDEKYEKALDNFSIQDILLDVADYYYRKYEEDSDW